jgi:YD repeat-containing protein
MNGTSRPAPIGSRRATAGRVLAGLALVSALLLALPRLSRAASPEGSAVTATGTVTSVKASERTVTVRLAEGGETRFVWNADTRITGVLTPGARVTVRYVAGDGGQNQALQITVARN